jgi:hypothetical protein
MTTYTDEAYQTTTYTDGAESPRFFCDEESIYCNNVDFYCDGTPVFNGEAYQTTTYTDETYS